MMVRGRADGGQKKEGNGQKGMMVIVNRIATSPWI
jgi:hypothetical protein